jgi:hypothetical protein
VNPVDTGRARAENVVEWYGPARATRRAFCARYADRDAAVLGTHFGPPTAGRIVIHGPAWCLRA